MANEIRSRPSPLLTGSANLYALIWDSQGRVWDTGEVAMMDPQNSSLGNAAVGLDHSADFEGHWFADFPADITEPGLYAVETYHRVGGSPASSDPYVYTQLIEWDGEAVVVPGILLDDAITEGALTDEAAYKIADHWGMSIVGSGVSRDDLLQGYQTKKVFNAAGTVLTIYSVDDTTVVQVCDAERFPLTIGGLKSLEAQ